MLKLIFSLPSRGGGGEGGGGISKSVNTRANVIPREVQDVQAGSWLGHPILAGMFQVDWLIYV